MRTQLGSGGSSKNFLYNNGVISPLINLGSFVNESGTIINTANGAQSFTIDQSVLENDKMLLIEVSFTNTSGGAGLLYIRLRLNGSTVHSSSLKVEAGTSTEWKNALGCHLTSEGVNQLVIEYTGQPRTMYITKIYTTSI